MTMLSVPADLSPEAVTALEEVARELAEHTHRADNDAFEKMCAIKFRSPYGQEGLGPRANLIEAAALAILLASRAWP